MSDLYDCSDDAKSLVAAYYLTEDSTSTWYSISFVNDSRKLLVASSQNVHLVDLKVLQTISWIKIVALTP